MYEYWEVFGDEESQYVNKDDFAIDYDMMLYDYQDDDDTHDSYFDNQHFSSKEKYSPIKPLPPENVSMYKARLRRIEKRKQRQKKRLQRRFPNVIK